MAFMRLVGLNSLRRLAAVGALVLAGLLPWAAQAETLTVSGQAFETVARVGEVDLKLNGVGFRAVAWFKAYAAGLYLPQKTAAGAQAMTGPGPKRLQMRMMWDFSSDEFAKAFNKGVAHNYGPESLAALKDRMAQFDVLVNGLGKVNKGDVVNLDFVPGKGLVFTVNGTVRGEPIPGADLYAALLSIFIGEKPTDQKLKASLLGAAWS